MPVRLAHIASMKLIHNPRTALDFLTRHAAPITLAVFLIIGVAIFDDYGVSVDEGTQRNLGRGALDYVLGREDSMLPNMREVDRVFGVAFEMPLAAVERVLRLEDPRAIYLTRHLLNHLFFLVGGFFAWLLAHRMFGSRLLALFALLMFLLHPRTYGESFFNSKDLPFLSMFAIALYLIHRAFRRDTVWAFVCAGVGVGLLTNTRILGIMPFAAVVGTLALDAVRSARPSGNSAARREGAKGARPVLANMAAFSLASIAALYATWPLLWEQPAALIDAFWAQARHPPGDNLFHGEMIRAPNIPWFYMPEWILVSVPPAALALSAAGAALALFAGLRRWRDALRNSPERFALLLVAFILIPIIAVIALDSHVYDGWRHLYFIYAPICLLATLALGRIAAALKSKPRLRAGVYALIAASLAITAVQMVRLHPYQYIYFNPFAGVHENLGETYEMDYWGIGRREALEWLLTTYSERHMIVKTDVASRWDIDRNLYVFPKDERRRISARSELPHFHVTDAGEDPIWSREIYGVPIVSIIDMREETEAAYRDACARGGVRANRARRFRRLLGRRFANLRQRAVRGGRRGGALSAVSIPNRRGRFAGRLQGLGTPVAQLRFQDAGRDFQRQARDNGRFAELSDSVRPNGAMAAGRREIVDGDGDFGRVRAKPVQTSASEGGGVRTDRVVRLRRVSGRRRANLRQRSMRGGGRARALSAVRLPQAPRRPAR